MLHKARLLAPQFREPSYPYPILLAGDMARHSETAREASVPLCASWAPGLPSSGTHFRALILPKDSHVGGKAHEVSRGFSSSRPTDLGAMSLTPKGYFRRVPNFLGSTV